jgi:hypothetical protein
MSLAALACSCASHDEAAGVGGSGAGGPGGAGGLAGQSGGGAGAAGGADAGAAVAVDADADAGADAGSGAGADPGADAGSVTVTDAGFGEPCVVAAHLDECCPQYFAASRAELAADECLVPYPLEHVDATLRARCTDAIAQTCAVDCVAPPPSSRTARQAPQGHCIFGDECQLAEDCGPWTSEP